MTDPRASFWLEAERNIVESRRYDTIQTGYWANLAVAAVNALMAALPDSVMEDVMVEKARQERLDKLDQQTVQRRIRKDLKSD